MQVPITAARSALQRHFGHEDFRPGQVDVIASVLSGRDTLGVLPTGGGKSLCFQVPALVFPGLTVVVSPLISLMQDQVSRLVAKGIAAAFLNSTLAPDEAARCLQAARRRLLRLLYVAPERLESPALCRALRGAVSLLAVDEAHCISEWGHEFRPSFRRIADAGDALGAPQTIALTATATPRVRHDIAAQLRLRQPCVIVGGFDRPNLRYAVRHCRTEEEKDAVLERELRAVHAPAVVYAPTRAAVNRITQRLRRARIPVAAYHGGLDAPTRRESQERFMRGGVSAIVATSAFGMGIDKPNVRLVVHHAMPATLEAYYQEAGRAGRDGLAARCVMLYSPRDRLTHEWFIDGAVARPDDVRQVHAAMRSLAVGDRVPTDPDLIARHCRGVDPRRAAAAIGILVRSGVIVRAAPCSRLHVRLLAAPQRVAEELPETGMEHAVLRAIWAGGGDAVQCVDVDALPDPVRGDVARRALASLRDRQFVEWRPLEPDHRFSDVSLEAAVDWAGLEGRRAAELRKLSDMERYATTRRCRRDVLLAYFGEALHHGCTGCDNCLHQSGNPRGTWRRWFH